jgi:hypothetical protein
MVYTSTEFVCPGMAVGTEEKEKVVKVVRGSYGNYETTRSV